ncbi:hypothetical protein TURU_042202 [Turdus rufiventris]|nr:hypothetical protein TURU_042202 [Turdus rufiventris]
MSRSAALLLCLLGCNVWKAVTKTLGAPEAAQGRNVVNQIKKVTQLKTPVCISSVFTWIISLTGFIRNYTNAIAGVAERAKMSWDDDSTTALGRPFQYLSLWNLASVPGLLVNDGEWLHKLICQLPHHPGLDPMWAHRFMNVQDAEQFPDCLLLDNRETILLLDIIYQPRRTAVLRASCLPTTD